MYADSRHCVIERRDRKSTIAAHLAVEAEKQGDGLVAVVDTDSQGSLSAWWNTREASTPRFLPPEVALDTHLSALAEHGVNLVVIDTPPALSDTIHTAIASADLVIIPVRPSPHDYGRSRWSSMSSRALESFCICDQWCHTPGAPLRSMRCELSRSMAKSHPRFSIASTLPRA